MKNSTDNLARGQSTKPYESLMRNLLLTSRLLRHIDWSKQHYWVWKHKHNK